MSDPIESNAYAISYRLLGSRPAAYAAAQIAAERVRRRFDEEGGLDVMTVEVEHWLPMLVDFTVEQAVRSEVYGDMDGGRIDRAGLREALRRRLVRASRIERVVGGLVHLAGYDVLDVASMLAMDPERVRESARILSPPPGVDYRDLGDPRLIGTVTEPEKTPARRPRRSTIVVAALIVLLVVLAVRCQGPRPVLVDEGAASTGGTTAVTSPTIN